MRTRWSVLIALLATSACSARSSSDVASSTRGATTAADGKALSAITSELDAASASCVTKNKAPIDLSQCLADANDAAAKDLDVHFAAAKKTDLSDALREEGSMSDRIASLRAAGEKPFCAKLGKLSEADHASLSEGERQKRSLLVELRCQAAVELVAVRVVVAYARAFAPALDSFARASLAKDCGASSDALTASSADALATCAAKKLASTMELSAGDAEQVSRATRGVCEALAIVGAPDGDLDRARIGASACDALASAMLADARSSD